MGKNVTIYTFFFKEKSIDRFRIGDIDGIRRESEDGLEAFYIWTAATPSREWLCLQIVV